MYRVNHNHPLCRMSKKGGWFRVEKGTRSTPVKRAAAAQKRQKLARRIQRERT